jgi:hypothetical protein
MMMMMMIDVWGFKYVAGGSHGDGNKRTGTKLSI